MEKQKLIYVESKAQFSPSEVSDKAIVFIKDTKEIWTHGVYFSCSGAWASPITLSLTGDTTGSVSIDGSGNASITTTTRYLSGIMGIKDANNAANTRYHNIAYYPQIVSGSSNLFPVSNNANAILSLNVHDYSYTHQLGFSSNGNIYHRRRNGGTWETTWKTILSSTNYTNFPHTFASLTNKPTTLSGYGITDCIPIIKGGLVTTDTDLSTLGMTTYGSKLSVSYTNNANVPSWGYGYSNYLIFRSGHDTYSGIATALNSMVTFIGGRNAETTPNNVPNWWFRIKGNSETTYDLNSIQTTINNLDNTYLKTSGGTMTGKIILTTDAAYLNDTASGYSIYGSLSSSNVGIGTSGLATIFSGAPTLNMVLRTSGDNLYHYNHSKSARYLILDTNNYSSHALPLSGGTMTGALNFANNTWNKVGDDAYMGDCDVAGMIGIKGSNAATPGFAMYNNSGTLLGKLYASGSDLYWSNAKILAASGTSKQFVMGDGSLYSNTKFYDTWTKTTTSGIAWFPIADITDFDQGTALFMVRGYAHSSIIFTVTKGYNNGNINVLAGGGSFNGDYAYIKGVRQISTVVEIGLNAAATLVQITIRVLQPTFTYSLRSSLVESTNTATPYVQYDINSGGNPDFGIISSKFTGNLIGNADTASKWKDARTITLTGDVTGSVSLDGSSNVTLTTATSGTGTTSFLKCLDKRNSYPAQIVTSGGNIGAAFMSASKLGLSEGSYYEALILRGWTDRSGGNDNALLFSKDTSSVYHSQYAFGSTTTWGTMYKFLDSNNYSSYALPLSGGTMTGNIILTTGSSYIADSSTSSSILGAFASGNSVEGLYSEAGVLVGKLATQVTLRSNGDDLWHYRNSDKKRYKILDAANYTNYTINYANSGITTSGYAGVINDGKLYYNSQLSFARFAPDDNHGATSYELIAELPNYGTGTNTTWITYGISGFMWSKRTGNCANISAYPITAIVNVGSFTQSKLRVSVTTDALIPFIVKYDDKYYIALKKQGSSTTFYFMGIKLNLLTTPIIVNDSSLIEEVAGPITETSTASKFYNNGTPQEYLHAGNYNYYALPLAGGTLAGILKSTQTAGSLGTSPIVFTGNVASTAGINNTYSHLASNLTTGGALQIFLGKASSSYNGGSIGYWHKGGDGSSGNALTFGLHSANNLMVIQGNGNVGINNTSPSYKLDVGGDIYSSGYVRAKSGFIKTDSSNSYVLLGGGGHKLLSDLSATHTHPWSDITSKPGLLGEMAKPIFLLYSFFDLKLGAYISTINNRFYSADLRYTVTTTNFASGSVHYLFDDNYDNRMQINMGTTATITIEGYNFVYNNGYIILSFYMYSAYPLLLPKAATVVATTQSGTTYTLNRATSVEAYGTMAFSIGLEYLTKLEITIVSQDDAYCGITNIDYFSRRTENTVRDCAVVTKYNANTLYHNLTAPKYIVKNGTSSQFLKADGSLDSTSYLPTAGGTLGNTSATETELRLKSSTATLRLVAYSSTTNYIQSGNSDFTGNATLKITGYNGNTGSNLYLNFANIYCRGGSYTNIDSGNYSSYALPLSGGTLTGTLISRDIRPSANLSYSLGTSSYYYNYVYANYFKKNGSSDSYVLLGGGGHKAVSDFAPNNVATLSSSGMGNSDQWTLVFEKSYPANYWYAPTTMFYIRSASAGCGILCFYNYWASGTQLDDYEKEVWFFGAGKSETGITFGGPNRDINDYFRIYIDKANFKYCMYYNRCNDQSLRIQELQFFTVPEPGEYLSTGALRSSFFTNSNTVVDLPTESSTLVRVPIKTTYNHDRTIKTTKSVYASSFYENSDIRLKENVRGIDQSDLTKQVDLVQFNFKDGGTKKYGVIAQQLEQVGLQNLVYENNGNKAVDYISLLVLEIQRLRNEIGELKQEINKKS